MSEFLTVPQLLRHVADNIEAGRPELSGVECQNANGTFTKTHLKSFSYAAMEIAIGKCFRIKPATRVINGFEVPEPVRNDLKKGQAYFCPTILNEELYSSVLYNVDDYVERIIQRGLVFLTADDAIATAKAMLGIDPNS
jgi:hypothetical protein